MPVAAYVEGAAASGGYYGIVSADRIFVKPSSTVGSVGVIVQAPLSAVDQQERVLKTFIRSGPDKAVITRDGIRQELQTLQNAFVGTVMRHRGGELTLSREEVSAADTYLGTEAVQNGFADEIGDLHSAIEYAAAQAGDLDRTRIDGDSYDVVYENPPLSESTVVIESDSVERVEGNIVYVDPTDSEEEFVRPVRYYAVWGVPSSASTTEREVSINATN
jgi:protease-4